MNAQDELIDLDNRVDRSQIVRRVSDWKRRIDTLYSDILRWLPAHWTGEVNGTVPFHEELMRRFDIAAENLKVLQLRSGDRSAKVEPRGLWIIGANGRLDLVRPGAHFLIVDRAEAFAEPDWQVASLEQRQEQRRFNRAVLVDLLE